jgi:arabinogalactan oligomer/maltooligosaccharide transport system substrate-binding protein
VSGRKRQYRELSWDQPDEELGPSFRRRRRRPQWLLVALVVVAVALVLAQRSRLSLGVRQLPFVSARAGPPAATPTQAIPTVGSAAAFPQLAITRTLPATRTAVSDLFSPLGLVTEPITITYWEQESDEGAALLDELAASFMAANRGVRVRRVHFLSGEQMREQFVSLALAGQGPDLVRGANDLTAPLVGAGTVWPAGSLYDSTFLGQFFPGALSAAVISNTVWALPDNYGSHLMLLYNKKLVQEVPADTRAWIAQLKTLSDPASGQYGLVYNLNEPYWLIPWIGGFGGWPLDQNDRPDLDNQATIDALQFVHDLKFIQHVTPVTATYDSAVALFKAGKAAYVIDGQWSLDDYRGAGIELGIAPLPRVTETGLDPVPLTAGKYWFFSANSAGPRLEAARRFVALMTSPSAQQTWLEGLGRLPSSQLAARSEPAQKDPLLAAEILQLGKGRGIPPAPVMLCVLQGMRPGLEVVMSGAASPTDGALKMQQGADGCLSGTP